MIPYGTPRALDTTVQAEASLSSSNPELAERAGDAPCLFERPCDPFPLPVEILHVHIPEKLTIHFPLL